MKALWLTSWYPNELTPANGDFIQRHAQAVSLFCKVDVIHVEKDTEEKLTKNIIINQNKTGNLTETIVLYKPFGISIFKKIISIIQYKKIYKQQIKRYIEQNGLPDIVHVHVAMKAGLIALWIKKNFKIPFVITDHWTMYNSQAVDSYENRNWLFKYFTKKIFKNASLFISVSKNLTETIAKKIIKVPYTIVYNTVDTNHFFNQPKTIQAPFTFVHVSTLKEQKNPLAIINAFIAFYNQFPTAKLLIIGDRNDKINSYIFQKKLPPNAVRLIGFLPYEKVAEKMQSSNVFVLFSKRENMPCVVLEALCCGLPVITSNAGGVAEVINKKNGIVVYNYDEKALTQAMIHVYKNYSQYNQQAIAKASAEKFSYTTIGKQMFDAYQSKAKI